MGHAASTLVGRRRRLRGDGCKDNLSRLGLCEADSILAEVVDTEVFAQESVTNDPDGAERSRDVQAGERRDTCALDIQDVILGINGILLSAEGEGERRQVLDALARNSHLSVP